MDSCRFLRFKARSDHSGRRIITICFILT
ncbi:hypothetical protein RHECNPAF_4460099 [Rhizobium etli CNPAF512]|nr:hypothetical protein RHECNPAF_4460099 [Rhizobium etli CNPAF512]